MDAATTCTSASRPDTSTAVAHADVAQPPTESWTGELIRVWVLAHRPESASAARRVTRAVLDEWGVDDTSTEQILLVVSELVTNAVEHALSPIALHVERQPDSTVHVEVDDGGPAAQEGAWAVTGGPEEHGRGSSIVDLLATAHGTHSLPDGVAYWADLPLPT